MVVYVYPFDDVEPVRIGRFPGVASVVTLLVVFAGTGAARSMVLMTDERAVALPTSQSLREDEKDERVEHG